MGSDTEFLDRHTELAREWLLDRTNERFDRGVEYAVRRAESPLESAFGVCFDAVAICLGGEMSLDAQREIVANKNSYRLDFVVTCRGRGYCLDTQVAVELDGHTFHEKTLEQVTRRNQRDRDLQVAGWRVMHFSFSEFNSGPIAAALDVYGAALQWAKENRIADGGIQSTSDQTGRPGS